MGAKLYNQAISYFASAIILLGILLASVVFIPQEIVLAPYNEYGWLGVLGILILISIFSYLIVLFVTLLKNTLLTILRSIFGISAKIIVGSDVIKEQMLDIVLKSRSYLLISGSRARDTRYLNTIENHISEHSQLKHIRIFFGKPKYKAGKDHIRNLRQIKIQDDNKEGESSLKIGIYEADDKRSEPERNFCISEKKALIILPSVIGFAQFDTALLVTKKKNITGWHNYTEQLYAACGIKIKNMKDFNSSEFASFY